MKKSNILLVIITVALQGFFACKSDDISPQTPSSSLSKQAQKMVIENNLVQITQPTDAKNITYLKDLTKASQFFQNLKTKRKDLSNNEKQQTGRVSNETVLSYGFFTFLNGDKTKIHFNTHPESIGEVMSADLNGEALTFTQGGNYVEMLKWGVLAIPNDLGKYQYYYAPIAIYNTVLTDGGWSSVQLLNQSEQANFEGEGGTWQEFYVPKPYQLGNDLPATDPWIPQLPEKN